MTPPKPARASKTFVADIAEARRCARATPSELRVLRHAMSVERTSGRIIAMNLFLSQASALRRVDKPWLVIRETTEREASPAFISRDKKTIVIDNASWEALLHEWCHWIHAQRAGWNTRSVYSVGADLYAEGFARAYMLALQEIPPPLPQERVAQALLECASTGHERRLAACVLLNVNEIAVRSHGGKRRRNEQCPECDRTGVRPARNADGDDRGVRRTKGRAKDAANRSA